MTELERLQDRIEQLEEALGVAPSMVDKIRIAFDIERRQAQTLGMLLQREFVSRSGLYSVLYGANPDEQMPADKNLDAILSRLRTALRPFGIEIQTCWGSGWHMTREMKQRVKMRLLPALPAPGVTGMERTA